MKKSFPITAFASSINKLYGISPLNRREAYLPFDYWKKPDRVCLITIDALGVSLIEKLYESLPFIFSEYTKTDFVLESEKPCTTAVNFVSMSTGLTFCEHKITSKEQYFEKETFLDIMRKCAVKTSLISYKESSMLKLFGAKANHVKENLFPQDKYTAELLSEEIRSKNSDFIWSHFMDIDKIGHRSGVESEDIKKALINTDSMIGDISKLCKQNNYTLIINADHGQHISNGYGVHDGSHADDMYVPIIVF